MVYQLYALTLPQEASLRLTEYRRALFARGENTSTLIFEPIIPLAFSQQPLPAKELGYLELPEKRWSIGAVSYEQEGSSYLPIEPSIEVLFPEGITAGTQRSLFPISRGIYLGTGLSDLPAFDTGLTFSELWLATYRIQVPDPRTWWTHIVYTQLEQRHLKRGRRT